MIQENLLVLCKKKIKKISDIYVKYHLLFLPEIYYKKYGSNISGFTDLG